MGHTAHTDLVVRISVTALSADSYHSLIVLSRRYAAFCYQRLPRAHMTLCGMRTLAAARLGLALLLLLLLSAPAAVRCCPPSVPSSTGTSSAHTPANTYTQADSELSVSTNSRFFLQLPSNPSTGFSWGWAEGSSGDAAAGLLRLLSCSYQAAPHAAGLVGSGGFELWELVSGAHAGQEQLQLSYARPWEQPQQQQKTATWTVTVTEAEAAGAGGRSL